MRRLACEEMSVRHAHGEADGAQNRQINHIVADVGALIGGDADGIEQLRQSCALVLRALQHVVDFQIRRPRRRDF